MEDINVVIDRLKTNQNQLDTLKNLIDQDKQYLLELIEQQECFHDYENNPADVPPDNTVVMLPDGSTVRYYKNDGFRTTNKVFLHGKYLRISVKKWCYVEDYKWDFPK